LIAIAYPNKDSSLTYIDAFGSTHTVEKYRAIGAGAKYARMCLEKIWSNNKTMELVAELGYFIIKCIEKFRLEESVGLVDENPQVWYIPNRYVQNEQGVVTDNDDIPAIERQVDPISIRVDRRIRKHEKQLATLFDSRSFRLS
jgi:20S proteasome alpha/beta subunit